MTGREAGGRWHWEEGREKSPEICWVALLSFLFSMPLARLRRAHRAPTPNSAIAFARDD
jgi:hypothetical protein